MAWTYETLRRAVVDYAENAEETFADNIDRFIMNAEERLYRLVQLPSLRQSVELTASAGEPLLAKPDGFQYAYSAAVKVGGSWRYLLDKDANFIRAAHPNPSEAGVPAYYANHDGSHFLLGPTPDEAYPVEVAYSRDPVSITESADGTSWLGDNAENALFYGAMIEANVFMKGDADMARMYEERYREGAALLAEQTEGRLKRDSHRDGEARTGG